MSYRSFKRLLGETGLERKCRLILGGGLFVLIVLSFYVYGYQMEKLVYEQTELTGQLLGHKVLLREHLNTGAALETNQAGIDWEDLIPEDDYESRFIRPNTDVIRYMPTGKWEDYALKELQNGREHMTEINKRQNNFKYLAAVRFRESCAQCHPTANERELGYTEYQVGDLMAAISVEMSLESTMAKVNVNRALLFSFAIIVAIMACLFTYVIVRYVILKPVAHLKDISEEIAAGNLDIRSNIQTADEFQELSLAFNRMLRRLVSMQDELRKVNTDLDAKLDELARANMALFEMNRLKSDFLATISHELRTPLNSILGFSDVLAGIQTLEPKQKRWIQNIQASGQHLLQLINDILDLAKLEAGKMQVNVDEFSLRDLVESQIQMTRPLADKKNIAVSYDVDPAIPLMSQDSSKLQQIISNLLSNAIKFTPEGGQIKVIARLDRANVVLSVVDNGVGIAPEDQKIIFEKFRQAESSLTRHHSGTGLGLSIVRELTKLLGGDEVELESSLGRGSTFTIRIPVHYTPTSDSELTLGDENSDFARNRQSEVRFYSSKDRTISVDAS